MKKIIFPILFIIISGCSSIKETSLSSHNNNMTKNVLVFLNNNSNLIINEEFKTEILKSANFVNNSNKIVIHTQKLEGLEYDYGIEILINTVEILDGNKIPTYIKYESQYERVFTTYDAGSTNIAVSNLSIPMQNEITIETNTKLCVINADFYLINLKHGIIEKSKKIRVSEYMKEKKSERKGDYIPDFNQFISVVAHNTSSLNPSFELIENKYLGNNKYQKITNSYSIENPNNLILKNTFIKLQNHYNLFIQGLY